MKTAIVSYYPQYFAKIAHEIEQHCDFRSAVPPEESHITPSLRTIGLKVLDKCCCWLISPLIPTFCEGSLFVERVVCANVVT